MIAIVDMTLLDAGSLTRHCSHATTLLQLPFDCAMSLLLLGTANLVAFLTITMIETAPVIVWAILILRIAQCLCLLHIIPLPLFNSMPQPQPLWKIQQVRKKIIFF